MKTTTTIILNGEAARLVIDAHRISFYGVHGTTREAAAAHIAISDAARTWANENLPGWTAFNIGFTDILSADAVKVEITFDHTNPAD